MRALGLVVLLGGCGFSVAGSSATQGPTGDDQPAMDGATDVPADVGGDATLTADAASDAMLDAPPAMSWVVIETLTVPVNGQSVMSTTVLANGTSYHLRASGTFVIQSGLGTLADAEWWDFANPQDGVAGVDVGLAVNDTTVDTSRTPKWGAMASNHIYEVAWTGNGQQLVAMLHDGNYSNNTGSLTLALLAYQ